VQLRSGPSTGDEIKGPYEERNSETRALLNVEESPIDILLQRLYYNSQCQYFYMGLMGISVLLVLFTMIFGLKIGQDPFFIFVESLLNIVILVDFTCRVRIQGVRRFLEGGLWNIFDVCVVIGTVIIFAFMLISRSLSLLIFEELSEEILLVAWSLFQTLRMIFIAKKQKLAQQSAKTLIDFSNIMDTDIGDPQMTGRLPNAISGVNEGQNDEIIVFDMKQMEQRQRQ
jgi:hypothetical protein